MDKRVGNLAGVDGDRENVIRAERVPLLDELDHPGRHSPDMDGEYESDHLGACRSLFLPSIWNRCNLDIQLLREGPRHPE